ncbi:arginine repressor [Agrilactobacillus fermenti]|uniref:arginine repressor n=1 Tax=Agrilactobacillus fermenti TaxID=2586909 RepID=UPI001E42C23F|nr:ArgR family transcriptional regulator [Agrilactobacillus fermenti]MCD2257465.1 ArgR family transcriptional regulator [Agrilactobacillus fermenti]
MKSTERRAIVLETIRKHVVNNQRDLIRLLNAQGVSITQATMSRDIKALKIIKAPDENGTVRYVAYADESKTDREALTKVISDVVDRVTQVQFMNVVKTLPSNGNVFAAAIDSAKLDDVVGTLAGHDTVIVISPDIATATEVHDWIAEAIDFPTLN